MARETILEVVRAEPRDGSFNLAAGQLAERQLRARAEARAAFPGAWSRLDRPKRLKWLKR
jgi:hypothetical protein